MHDPMISNGIENLNYRLQKLIMTSTQHVFMCLFQMKQRESVLFFALQGLHNVKNIGLFLLYLKNEIIPIDPSALNYLL